MSLKIILPCILSVLSIAAIIYMIMPANTEARYFIVTLDDNGQRPTPEELKTLPPITLDDFVHAYRVIKATHPTLDPDNPRFARLVYQWLKENKNAPPPDNTKK